MGIGVVYFSNHSGNTKRFVERLGASAVRIPIDPSSAGDLTVDGEYVLFVPTYGGGNEKTAIPKPVKNFLNIPHNRDLLRGVVGFGNTNFGEDFCLAAEIISRKTGVPIVARVEIFGTDEDVKLVEERMRILYGTEV